MKRSAIRSVVAALALALAGCAAKGECTTEVTAANGTWTGLAQGKNDERATRLESLRDACRQMCAASKAESIDGCAAKCAADAEAGKIGMKTTCR